MQTLFIFTDILQSLSRIESQIQNLGTNYLTVAQRTAIDDALIAQFQAKAAELTEAANTLLQIDYDPDAAEETP